MEQELEMERKHSTLVSEEKRRRKNEKLRAKRASETENEKRKRCDKRNAADRARRALNLKTEQQTSTKRQVTEQSFTTQLHQKRQRLATESEESLKNRLEQLRSQHALRLEAQTCTPVDRTARTDHLLTLCQIRMSMESEKEREARLQKKSANTNSALSTETEEERASRLQQMSDLQQQRIAAETPVERATRISSAQERMQNRAIKDEQLPKLEQCRVQAKMQAFHKDITALSSPTCITCMESFPGMKMTSKSECARCSRDKHTPKVFSKANNMNPGPVPPELQVRRNKHN